MLPIWKIIKKQTKHARLNARNPKNAKRHIGPLGARARTLMEPLGSIWRPKGLGQGPYGPGPGSSWCPEGSYGARTLIGYMGPGQDPYHEAYIYVYIYIY